jgi:hypothetical protein
MKNLSKRQWFVLFAVLLLLLTGVGMRLFVANPRLARVKKMREELFTPAGQDLSPSERREKVAAFRQEQEKLSPEERKTLWDDMRKKRRKELEDYAKMSQEDKNKFLDDRINQMEAQRASWQRRNSGNGGGGQPPPFGAPQANAGGRFNLSQDEREHRRKEWLDSTTPEERVLRDQFLKDLQARRAQRGLPSSPWGPRGGR